MCDYLLYLTRNTGNSAPEKQKVGKVKPIQTPDGIHALQRAATRSESACVLTKEEELRVVDETSDDNSVKVKSIDPCQVGYFVKYLNKHC